jgi:hypothetical protein
VIWLSPFEGVCHLRSRRLDGGYRMDCLDDGKAFCGRGMLELEKVELVSQKQLSQLILSLRIEMEQGTTQILVECGVV